MTAIFSENKTKNIFSRQIRVKKLIKNALKAARRKKYD